MSPTGFISRVLVDLTFSLSLFLQKSLYHMVLMENRVNLGNIIWNKWISNGGVGKHKLIGVEDRIRSV